MKVDVQQVVAFIVIRIIQKPFTILLYISDRQKKIQLNLLHVN